MKVELIDYQKNALDLLLYTKNTRLSGGESGLNEISKWPMSKKLDHLEYMRKTIKSSWEFISYTFHISGVTRAFTHQLVRSRHGSYAQQSQRTVDVRDQEVINETGNVWFDQTADKAKRVYAILVDSGVDVQNARGILPTNMTTDIIAKFDLNSIHNMALVRLCTRTQGEYQRVFKEIRSRIVEVHPWAGDFIHAQCAWDGTCAFPNYTECPVQEHTIKANDARLKKIRISLAIADHVANPIAKDGRTM